MKELLFLRHSKSSWEWEIDDRHRPLQPKGIKAITAVARHWKSVFLSFDCMMSSPANRAQHTATILAHEIGFPLEHLRLKETLYSFNSQDIIRFVKQLDDTISKVILVGHNPAFTYAARFFSVDPVPELKTADWISLTFVQNQWKMVEEGQPTYGTKKEALKDQ
ncbi:MAG: SixA phosphatase family protein [Flavobacteriaceae bacterium]